MHISMLNVFTQPTEHKKHVLHDMFDRQFRIHRCILHYQTPRYTPADEVWGNCKGFDAKTG